MKELISPEQASLLMRIILILAPAIGLAWGAAKKKITTGLAVGIIVGGGNFILWHVYNAITNRLGLDTVLNFEVNLGLFVVVGIVVGVVFAVIRSRINVTTDTDTIN